MRGSLLSATPSSFVATPSEYGTSSPEVAVEMPESNAVPTGLPVERSKATPPRRWTQPQHWKQVEMQPAAARSPAAKPLWKHLKNAMVVATGPSEMSIKDAALVALAQARIDVYALKRRRQKGTVTVADEEASRRSEAACVAARRPPRPAAY